MPGRLNLYNAALFARYDVSVRSLLVLLRPKADAANLIGKLAYGEPGYCVQFEYEVIRLWKQPVEMYLQAGLAALPLATLCQMPADKPLAEALRDVVREIERRVGHEANHAAAMRLMTAAYILTGLHVEKGNLSSIFRGVGIMNESTAFDEVMEEGERRGELKRSHRLLLAKAANASAPSMLPSIPRLGRSRTSIAWNVWLTRC